MLYPVSNGILRLASVVALVLLWGGALWMCWQRKWLRIPLLGLPVLIVTLVILPGRTIGRDSLRRDYVTSLRSFEGCRYVWGGENRLGIDCSGLARAGLINASIRNAFQTANPAMLRFALDLWWHDCSAKALGEGYRRQTIQQFAAPTINSIDPNRLKAGDLAVTDDGVHVMVYLGSSGWIEADPEAKRVLIINAPTSNPWFESPVTIMRWQVLDETSKAGDER
jgi:hypothetical protein